MWSVYQCELLGLGETPKNEVEVASGFLTPLEAMRVANMMKRANPSKSYAIGCAS